MKVQPITQVPPSANVRYEITRETEEFLNHMCVWFSGNNRYYQVPFIFHRQDDWPAGHIEIVDHNPLAEKLNRSFLEQSRKWEFISTWSSNDKVRRDVFYKGNWMLMVWKMNGVPHISIYLKNGNNSFFNTVDPNARGYYGPCLTVDDFDSLTKLLQI